MTTQSSIDTSTTGRHIPALDGIRGVAILLVLVVHLFGFNTNYNGGFAGRLLARTTDAGWVGVDLFFALSGFLITGILYDTVQSKHYFKNFYVRRSLRISPLYYGFICFGILVVTLIGYQWFGRSLLIHLTYTQNLLSAGPVSTANWFNLVPFWSLAIEEHFYLFWPSAIYLLRSKKRIVTCALILAAISIGVRFWLFFSGKAAASPYLPYDWTPARLDTLLFGAVLAMLVRSQYRDRVLRLAPTLACLGFVMLVLYGVHAKGIHHVGDPGMSTIGYSVVGIVACAVIASALRPESLAQRAFSVSVLRFFGTYSYGLYVFHFTVARLLELRFRPLLREHVSNALAIVGTGVLTMAISVVVAMLSFHFFEKPILSLKRHFQDDSPVPKLRKRLSFRG